ncbi:RDD family protein, partial [Streptomyces sp. SM12]|uniref:RDD family protein n=1 Tax=Streptomyces sp. SM12 TaxID=1071602 RepID=UPI0027E487E0
SPVAAIGRDGAGRTPVPGAPADPRTPFHQAPAVASPAAGPDPEHDPEMRDQTMGIRRVDLPGGGSWARQVRDLAGQERTGEPTDRAGAVPSQQGPVRPTPQAQPEHPSPAHPLPAAGHPAQPASPQPRPYEQQQQQQQHAAPQARTAPHVQQPAHASPAHPLPEQPGYPSPGYPLPGQGPVQSPAQPAHSSPAHPLPGRLQPHVPQPAHASPAHPLPGQGPVAGGPGPQGQSSPLTQSGVLGAPQMSPLTEAGLVLRPTAPWDTAFGGAGQAYPAGLGRRLLARLIDSLLPLGAAVAMALPLVDRARDHVRGKIEAVEQAGVTETVWLLDGTTAVYLGLVVGVFLLAGLLFEALPTVLWGRSPGKAALGLRLATMASHDKPGAGAALSRWLLHSLMWVAVVGVLNVVWCLWDRPWRQCWHDKAAGTFVASVRSGD